MRLLSRVLAAALLLLTLPAHAQVSNPAFVGVFSFNGRIGAVSLMAADVTAALGYPPYSALNPAGYQTSSQVAAQIATALANTAPGTGTTVSGVVGLGNGGTGATSASAALTALGAYPATNPAGYQTASQTVALAQSAALVPVIAVPACGTAQALTAPATGSAAYSVTLTGNCAFTLAGGTVGQLQTLTLILREGAGGFTPAMPVGVKWGNGGIQPTFDTSAGSIAVVTFSTADGGTTWFGSY